MTSYAYVLLTKGVARSAVLEIQQGSRTSRLISPAQGGFAAECRVSSQCKQREVCSAVVWGGAAGCWDCLAGGCSLQLPAVAVIAVPGLLKHIGLRRLRHARVGSNARSCDCVVGVAARVASPDLHVCVYIDASITFATLPLRLQLAGNC